MQTAGASRLFKPWSRPLSRRLMVVFLPAVIILAAITATLLTGSTRKTISYENAPGVDPAVMNRHTVDVRRGPIKKKLIVSGELRAVHSHTIFAQTSEETK